MRARASDTSRERPQALDPSMRPGQPCDRTRSTWHVQARIPRACRPIACDATLRSDQTAAPATPSTPTPPNDPEQRLLWGTDLDLRASRLASHDAIAAAFAAMASGMNQLSSVPSASTVNSPAVPARTAPRSVR